MNDITEKPRLVARKKALKITNKMMEDCNKILLENHPGRDLAIKEKEEKFSPKSSLDQVAKELENILRKLDQNSNYKSSGPKPLLMKIEHKEFFQNETSQRKHAVRRAVVRKLSVHNKRKNSAIVNKISQNSIKIMNIKNVKSATLLKHGSVNAIISSQLLKNVPSKRSELAASKQNLTLKTKEPSKFHGESKRIDRAKIAKNVQNMMKAALVESEYTHKIPVIDVANFINESLKLASSTDFPNPRKIVEKKTKHPQSNLLSDSDSYTKSNENIKLDSNNNETSSDSKFNSGSSYSTRETEKISLVTEKNINNKNKQDNSRAKIIIPIPPTMHTLKSLPNNGYINRSLPKTNIRHDQSKSGNLILKGKSQSHIHTANINPPHQTGIAKNYRKTINRPSSLNGSKKQPHINKIHNIVNDGRCCRGSNVKIRSNSMLRKSRSSASSRFNTSSVNATILASRQQNIQNNISNATTKSAGGIKRETCSTQGNSRRQLSTPSFPSSASKHLGSKKISHFSVKESSFTPLHGVSSNTPKRQLDPFSQLKDEVNRAIKDRKTFTVRGNYPAVRRALLKRGWIEKLYLTDKEKQQQDIYSLKHRSINELVDMMNVKDLSDICKKLIKSKLMVNHQVDLFWGPNYESFQINPDKVKLTKINKFKRDVFSYTSKQGLCDAARNAHWFNFPGLAQINHPRTYALAKHGETKDFIRDFRRTATQSLLKWLIKSHETKECKIISNSGKIPLEAFQFAANECNKMVLEGNNQDIDCPLKEASDNEWTQFLEYYYKIIHVGNHFKTSQLETENSIIEKSTYLIKKLIPHYPHLDMDGVMNIWILKPSVGSQGKGIHICRTLQYIMQTVKNNYTTKYIVQKYIERPLLIFNTKFDIRQWFLISSASPLTIWMYKECYLRFSSQTYNLRKLHESIHLTNNSVQQRYQNTTHDITLPDYNMWDSIQFRKYLSNIGYPDIYRRIIYKGMKECIICAVMIHQDKIDKRRNCFELYGADFMLTEDFQPWLIEINSSPALYASTPITSRMCPQVLEDTIKVVVDRAADSKARTGNFELIYKQPYLPCSNNANTNSLKISGTPLPDNYFCLVEEKLLEKMKSPSVKECLQLAKEQLKPKMDDSDVKETLENLLKFVQDEKKKRRKKIIANKGTDPMEFQATKLDDKISSCTCTSSCISFTNLKSQLDVLMSQDFSITEEGENMINQALKMLQTKKTNEIVKHLLEVIESIVNQPRSSGA